MRNPLSFISRPFITPVPLTVAREELQYAELDLLRAQSQLEYASAMLTYQTMRVNRLRKHVAEGSREAVAQSLRSVP